MKKVVALLLLFAMILPMAACGEKAPEPSDSMGFEVENTPVPPAQQPSLPVESSGEDPAEATPVEPEETPNPNTTPTPAPTPESGVDATATEKVVEVKDVKAARKLNPDVVGWIKVPNTNINYPILFSADFYYNTHDINKKKSNNGSIYAYFDRLTRNNVIAGHNMRKSGVMFHELHKLQDNKESLKEKKNRTFEIDYWELKKWEVFALYEVPDNEPKKTREYNTQHLAKASASEMQTWIDTQISKSEVDLGVKPSPNDFFITLVTCGDNYDYNTAESRLYFFLYCPA